MQAGRTSFKFLRRIAGTVAVLAVALALRVLAAGVLQWFVQKNVPNRLCVFPDTEYYWQLAKTIRAGSAYEIVEWGSISHRALRTPGYPLFLAACQAIFGEWSLGVRLVQAVLGTLSVGLVYLLTQRLVQCSGACPTTGFPSRTAPLVAAGLAAIDPYYVAISELLLSEALFVPLMLATLWGLAVLCGAGDDPDRAGEPIARQRDLIAIAVGAANGAAVLTKPSFGLFLPGALLCWVFVCAFLATTTCSKSRSGAWCSAQSVSCS